MAEKQATYDLLKTFSGLIHRQPLFIPQRLDVDSYHLTFLDKLGQRLDDDAAVPDFVRSLPEILPAIGQRQKALLTIPTSWQDALAEAQHSTMMLTLDINGHAVPRLKDGGFTFAGHANGADWPEQPHTLLIDLDHFQPAQLLEQLPHWRTRHQTLCAVNVNATEQYDFCRQHELDLLQGRFYTLPQNREGRSLSPSARTLMTLLVELQDPDIETEQLADTINRDVTLSYKLLRLINSAFFGLPKKVSSTHQAVLLLGLNQIKTWASLLSLSGLDDKPNELRCTAMVRARMCELLARYYKGQADCFFAAGLFSTLDALLDKPLHEIMGQLPLSEELRGALLDRTGAAGSALKDVLDYERGDWDALACSPLPAEVLVRTYLDALSWARELNLQLQD